MEGLVVLIILVFLLNISCGAAAPRSTFIVNVRNELRPSIFPGEEKWYNSMLYAITNAPPPNILYVYKTVFHGFSVSLTLGQSVQLGSHHAVHSVLPDPIYNTQTTRSPEFLGLKYNVTAPINRLLVDSDQGSSMVIGFMDTGIWPECHSFDDNNMPPVPNHWKGVCEGGPDITCNNKLVGVRYFKSGMQGDMEPYGLTARDDEGHGTHTASTAAGRFVPNASFLGLASGEARGTAPKARIAVYRVCWESTCSGSDVLAAMEKAIDDGVNIISLSLGGLSSRYSDDPIAMAAFSAMEKGVFVSASSGNYGPYQESVSNIAPWVATIGAGTVDRKFPVDIVLENGETVEGQSLYVGAYGVDFHPLVYTDNGSMMTSLCSDELGRDAVRGKLLFCMRDKFTVGVEMARKVDKLGGLGLVLANTEELGEETPLELYMIPCISIPFSSTFKLVSYINKYPGAVKAKLVSRGTRVDVKPAPLVARFSSRGPNPVSRYVLKPDMIAPGDNILGAWPINLPIPDVPGRKSPFRFLSGTSMSCPHVSGVAALLKAAHPSWSPAMIRSALMTTARLRDNEGKPLRDKSSYKNATIWATGAGQVDPNKASDPGLVYDLNAKDYIRFLCSSNYTDVEVRKITKMLDSSCNESMASQPWDLNYPAIVVWSEHGISPFHVVVWRSVTSVGMDAATYKAVVTNPVGATVQVNPPTLTFKAQGEIHRFRVTISASKGSSSWFQVGSILWSDGTHFVNSPIVVGWGNPS